MCGGQQVTRDLFDVTEPAGESCRGINGRREEDEADVWRHQNERLLPNMSTIHVVDVVDLIEDHGTQRIHTDGTGRAEMCRGRGMFEEQIAQDFRGHHDNLGIRIGLDVTRQDAHRGAGEEVFEIMVFLVAEGLNGCRVEDTLVLAESVGNRIFGHQSLTRARFGGNKDVFVVVDCGNRMGLKGVEGEGVGDCGICWEGRRFNGEIWDTEEWGGHVWLLLVWLEGEWVMFGFLVRSGSSIFTFADVLRDLFTSY